MMSPNNRLIWVKKKLPIKFKPYIKDTIERVVRNFIQKSPNLKKLFSPLVVKAGCVYIYKFSEPVLTSDDCSLEFENTPGRWVTVANGTLEECLETPEKRKWLDPYS
jgi:hypothetical protein